METDPVLSVENSFLEAVTTGQFKNYVEEETPINEYLVEMLPTNFDIWSRAINTVRRDLDPANDEHRFRLVKLQLWQSKEFARLHPDLLGGGEAESEASAHERTYFELKIKLGK